MTGVQAGKEFAVIGENVHATRVLVRGGPGTGEDSEGNEAIVFDDIDGRRRAIPVPDSEKQAQAYLENRIKHVKIAVELGMAEGEQAGDARAYLTAMALRQAEAGAAFLDVNVDEIAPKLDTQLRAMRWLVELLAPVAPVPLSIDSSNLAIIRAGFEAHAGRGPTPMLNSASLERLDALDLAVDTGCAVIVTAAGDSGMPSGAEERVSNATAIVEHATGRGIAPERIYIDPLVFPISVDGQFVNHCLDAIRALRERLGPDIWITGGMSNVSFGLPFRRLLNDVFIVLAVEAGADSGILDPLSSPPGRVLELDRSTSAFAHATDVLTGADEHCRAYLKAYRAGELGETG